MISWFRFYHEALDDPKVQRLPAPLFKTWVNLLCLASREANRGHLPAVVDIAFALRLSEDDASSAVYELIDRGLLILDGDGFRPHGWDRRQYRSDDVTTRVRTHRQRAKQGETLPETLHETVDVTKRNVLDTDTDTDTEKRTTVVVSDDRPKDVPEKPKKERIKPVPKPVAHKIPDGWTVTPELLRFGGSLGFSEDEIRFQAEAFVDHFTGTGGRKVDWAATFRNWLRNAPQYQRKGARASPNGVTLPRSIHETPAAAAKRLAALESDVKHLERTGAPDWKIRNVRRELESARAAMEARA